MKKIIALILAAVCVFSLCACGNDVVISSSNDAPSEENAKKITLKGDSIEVESGASVSGSSVTISAAGTYSVSGTLNDGQIIVNTGDDDGKVSIILSGADISSLSSSAIVVEKASKVNFILAEGSVNRLVSGTEDMLAAHDEAASGAVISAKDDIDFKGTGALQIYGYINNGIACKNDIDIEEGSISIVAANNGIRGSDSVEISGGSVTIDAGNDGIKSSTIDKEGKGFISITGGEINISAVGDGIAAATDLTVDGGTLSIKTSGDADIISCKALKAGGKLTVTGGSIDADSADNAMHADASVMLSGGVIKLASLKDGIRVKELGNLEITGGDITINAAKKCFDADNSVSVSGGSILAFGFYKNGAPALCEGLKISDDASLSTQAIYKCNTIIVNA